MSNAVTLNGITYLIPDTGEGGWGEAVTNYLVALSTGVLQKAGGNFTLTANVDFGASFGLRSQYYSTRTASSASTGNFRLARADVINWRNDADSANLSLAVNSSDQLTFDGNPISSLALGAADTVLKINTGGTDTEYGFLADANIAAAAAIAVNKLAALTANKVPTLDASGFLEASSVNKHSLINMMSTGLLTGGSITQDVDPAKYDVAAGTGIVVDNYTDPNNPTYNEVSWNAFDAQVLANIATQTVTYISIDSGGNISEFDWTDKENEFPDKIFLGSIAHPDGATIAGIADEGRNVAFDYGMALLDLSEAIGPINVSGNVYSGNGANLSINKSAGVVASTGGNIKVSNKSYSRIPVASEAAGNIFATYSDGGSGWTNEAPAAFVVPGKYDDASGTLQNVANNKWTVKRIYTTISLTVMHYGQALYSSQAAAIDGIQTEAFSLNPDLDGALLRSFLIVRGNATDLTDTSEAMFVDAGKFGGAGANGGTSSTTDLQQAYNNSATPEIVLTAAGGGLCIQDAATPLGTTLFEVADNGGANKFFSVDANGIFVGNSRDASAAIDITSTTQGLGLPNMTTTQRDAISTPKTGLKIWNTTTGTEQHYNSSAWASLSAASVPVATPDVTGTVTSFVPVIKSSVKDIGDAAYTILDTDGFSLIKTDATALTADRTVTLPTASANAGRKLYFKKGDTGAFDLIIDGEGSETIDGATTIALSNQFDSLSIECDGDEWHVLNSKRTARTVTITDTAPSGTLDLTFTNSPSAAEVSAFAFRDSSGVYWMTFVGEWTQSSATTAQVTFGGTTGPFSQACTGHEDVKSATFGTSGALLLNYDGASKTAIKTSGTVKLASKPSWFDANREL